METTMQAAPCSISPDDMREQARLVGDDLMGRHGKCRFYSVDQVKAANRRCNIKLDVVCWSHALFNSHEEFDRMHAAAVEGCDYIEMKQKMLQSMSHGEDWSWFDFDLSWLEFPDIEWSIFDLLD